MHDLTKRLMGAQDLEISQKSPSKRLLFKKVESKNVVGFSDSDLVVNVKETYFMSPPI